MIVVCTTTSLAHSDVDCAVPIDADIDCATPIDAVEDCAAPTTA